MAMATIDLAEFVTVREIPVLETGINYPASTGPFTCTSSMLEEAVLSQSDPHILPPRVKIGHSDNPINDDIQSLWEELNQARDESKPALGTIQNLRVIDSGQTLIGDFYGVPAWLAAILETAYPARSIEGGHWKNDANGKDYAFMLEAVSLLGVVGPGCTSLADLQELFSRDGPNVTVVEMSRSNARGGDPMPVVAQVNVEDIRRAFYDDWAQGDRYWFWDRELLIDPLEMIIQDPDTGQLYKLPINLKDGDGIESVDFGTAEPVKVKYVPDSSGEEIEVEAARLIAPQIRGAGQVLAVNHKPFRLEEYERRKEAPTMGVNIPDLRKALSVGEDLLPDDASEEQINKALTAAAEAEVEEEVRVEEENTPPEGEVKPEGKEVEEEESPELRVSEDGTVKVDAEQFKSLQGAAQMGVDARKVQLEREREDLLTKAVEDGKIPPARKEHWRKLYSADPEGTKATIESLADVVPLKERGESPSDETLSTEGYDQSWLSPKEREQIKAAHEASGPITQEVS